MKLTIRERAQKVFECLSSRGQPTLRAMAQALGLSKSSVHRHRQAIARRQQHPESSLWESQVGGQWLKLLVLATIFVFGLQQGVGCESLYEFFRLLRLESHIGVSISSLRKLRAQMEAQILEYQRQQQSQLVASEVTTEICAGVDETFFDQAVLVMLDLSSGFILVEELSEDYRDETWQQFVQPVLNRWGLQVRYCVSDRAKALIKLALKTMNCASVADLFHALRELSTGIGSELANRLFRVNRCLQEVVPTPANREHYQQLQAQQKALQTAQQQYRCVMHQLTTTLHPFAIRLGTPQTSLSVATQLQAQLQVLKGLQRIQQLPDYAGSIPKVERQLQDLSASVDLWWEWVRQSLSLQDCDSSVCTWAEHCLLPALYWHQQTTRTKTPTLKATYLMATQQAHAALMRHPITAALSEDQFNQWQLWAREMVTKFQRTSSAVEGRNGYLSQIHHNRRGLSPLRLRVMTVLHNFYLQRSDGTTAAQRLFGQPVPHLFEWLVQQMPDLPQARRRNSAPKPKPFALPSVPP